MPKTTFTKRDVETVPLTNGRSVTRTTIVIPTTLDQNLQALGLTNGETKNQMITAALRKYVEEKGLRPDQSPRFTLATDRD